MEKELNEKNSLTDLIKNQLDVDTKKVMEFIDFKKNNEKIIQDLINQNILKFGDFKNDDKKIR